MSEFQFQKSQRVTVPAQLAGAENVQGVVTGNTGRLGREPSYQLQWPAADMMQENFQLVPCTAEVMESELLKAQPPKMVPIDEANRRAEEAYRAGADDLREEQAQERVMRAAKRAKKPAARKRSRR